jgi:hypothetical protein
MLQESDTLNKLQPQEQAIFARLADRFSENANYMFLDPIELTASTQLGTPDQWTQLLNMVETQNFIKGQMAFIGQVNQRKTYMSLVRLALEGNQQAAKQVQELSGIMNQQDSNRVIILHRVPRPNERVVVEDVSVL